MSDILTEITHWLERERKRFATAAERCEIPPSQIYMRWIGQVQKKGGVQYEHQTIRKSSFNDVVYMLKINQNLDLPSSTPAGMLLKEFGGQCEYKPSTLNFENEPEEWIEKHLLHPTRDNYLRELESLDTPDPVLAERLAEELLEMIRRSHFDYVTCLAIGGVRLEKELLSLEKVVIRPLRPDELGALAPPPTSSSPLHTRRRGIYPLFLGGSAERWALEVRESFPKIAARTRGTFARRFVLAMQLLGFELYGSGQATLWTEPGHSLDRGGILIALPRHGNDRDCTAADLHRAIALAEKIPEGAVLSPSSPNEVALHRFLLGAARDEKADAVIDFVIALESVFLSDVNEGEYAFKFRLFGAYYLAETTAERENAYHKLRDLYNLRSRLVHGAKSPSRDMVHNGARQAREFAGRTLVKVLEDGLPSYADLTKRVLN